MPDRANVRRHARLAGFVGAYLRAGGTTVEERTPMAKPSALMTNERRQLADLLTDEWAFEVYAGMSLRDWSRALVKAETAATHDGRSHYGVVALRPGWDRVGDLLVVTTLSNFADTLTDRSNA